MEELVATFNKCKATVHNVYDIAKSNKDIIILTYLNIETGQHEVIAADFERMRMDYRSAVIKLGMHIEFALHRAQGNPVDISTFNDITTQLTQVTESADSLRTLIMSHTLYNRSGRRMTLSGIGLSCIGGLLLIPVAVPVLAAASVLGCGVLLTCVGFAKGRSINLENLEEPLQVDIQGLLDMCRVEEIHANRPSLSLLLNT